MPQSIQIAVIGLNCRFPDAATPEAYWQNLLDGTESIRPQSAEEIAAQGADPDLLTAPEFVNAGTVVADADLFDADYFGISPREAELMDPL